MVHLFIKSLKSTCPNNDQDWNNEAIGYPVSILILGWDLYINVVKD